MKRIDGRVIVDASLFPVRDAWLLANVRERYGIGTRFVLYFGGFDLRNEQVFNDYERELFTRVVAMAEKEGKTVTLEIRDTPFKG